MCDREHFDTLRNRVDALEDSVKEYQAKTDERIVTLFKSCDRLYESVGIARNMIYFVMIIFLIVVLALVYGAVGHGGFNAVTHAASGAAAQHLPNR